MFTRCHQKRPQEFTPFVHEKSPTMSMGMSVILYITSNEPLALGLGADKFLAMLKGKIRVTPFFKGPIW